MLAIFADMVEDSMKVFIDDFFFVRYTLSSVLLILRKCFSRGLRPTWYLTRKCLFMVKKGIMLGHKISGKGLQVDKAKMEVFASLPPPISVKGVRSFVGHPQFLPAIYQGLCKVASLLCKFLEKDSFVFDATYMKAFEGIKEKLVEAPVIVSPNWS